jgi:hypothetical protein
LENTPGWKRAASAAFFVLPQLILFPAWLDGWIFIPYLRTKEVHLMEMSANPPMPPSLERVAGLLEKQIAESHQWVLSLFNYAGNEKHPLPTELQLVIVKSAVRLMQANASAASALKRLHGTRHTVAVEGDTPRAKNEKQMGTSDA